MEAPSHMGVSSCTPMDLRQWITDQHTMVLDRLRSGVLGMVPKDRWYDRVDDGGSSIAWLLFHLAHHQDLAVSTAIRDHPTLLSTRRERLGLMEAPAWAGLPETEDPSVSRALDLDELERYVSSVYDTTAAWLDTWSIAAFDSVPDSSRRLVEVAGIPPDELGWLHTMWDGKPMGWFVQWECIGHGFTHVGEMVSIRNRMGLSPF
jgi:hypothetical protein